MQGTPWDIFCFMIKVYCEKDKTEKNFETQCLDNTNKDTVRGDKVTLIYKIRRNKMVGWEVSVFSSFNKVLS